VAAWVRWTSPQEDETIEGKQKYLKVWRFAVFKHLANGSGIDIDLGTRGRQTRVMRTAEQNKNASRDAAIIIDIILHHSPTPSLQYTT